MTSESAPAVDHLFGFTGRLFDEETGLQNNLNRWYDPQVGRWLTEDPSGHDAGDPNLYRYAGNSPLTNIDPNGLCWTGIASTIGNYIGQGINQITSWGSSAVNFVGNAFSNLPTSPSVSRPEWLAAEM